MSTPRSRPEAPGALHPPVPGVERGSVPGSGILLRPPLEQPPWVLSVHHSSALREPRPPMAFGKLSRR
ncbi:hypothetical protein ACIBAG_03620 [Streptomyces sp. NPDC051243]|uniref:hypothetical protein n=1 Tax=Streptomyces sp. NPDC051243 TaxID=3365646 RepID=UPI0037B3FF2A